VNSNGAKAVRASPIREWSAIVGQADGSIIAAIIAIHTPANQPGVPRLVHGPSSIPRISTTVTVHATPATASSAATSAVRDRAAASVSVVNAFSGFLSARSLRILGPARRCVTHLRVEFAAPAPARVPSWVRAGRGPALSQESRADGWSSGTRGLRFRSSSGPSDGGVITSTCARVGRGRWMS